MIQPASIDTIKQELRQRSPKETLDLLLQLTRFKKENKELLTYLLFEADDNESYVDQVKQEIKEAFHEIDGLTPYQYKKQFRRIQRKLNKPIKYMNNKPATVELYMYVIELLNAEKKTVFIQTFREKTIQQYTAKIEKLLPAVEDDLASDIRRKLVLLSA